MSDAKKPGEINPISEKSAVALHEEAVLKFWQENKIFEKSLKQTEGQKEYVFYDGPPFATGLPHYGHIVAGTIKDVIPRYQTMRGNFVRRRWGWDCHGLPVENLIEKKLDLKFKKEIEEYGIEKFNRAARAAVLEYVDDWKWMIPRLGRFVDMENDYRTMDSSYTETVMQIFKRLADKNLIYEGYKSMQICPRCETTLSNFEVGQGYKDITDISVTVKFKLKTQNAKLKTLAQNDKAKNTFILAWTTTPWTLPGNVALAVNSEIEYVKLKAQNSKLKTVAQNSKLKEGETYILAKERLEQVLVGEEYEVIEEFKGKDLIGLEYEPVFDYYAKDGSLKNKENGWKIVGADFVTTEDGTGVVHIAPAFGEDDMALGQKANLPFIQHVSMDGRFKSEVTDWAGELVKPKSAPGVEDAEPTDAEEQAMDIKVLKNLAARGLLFSKQKIVHSYPHCWRCGTPLLNYATSSWFVKVTDLKDKLVANNNGIGWVPEHIKDGRFGKWLEGARDWAISRSRYWGAPLPVWKCEQCKEIKVIGSVEELSANKQNHGNRFFLMRHGQAENNLTDTIDCQLGKEYHLTVAGQKQVKTAAAELKEKKIDLIVSSPFTRAKETAELVATTIGGPIEVILDSRLGEYNVGSANGGQWTEVNNRFSSKREKLNQAPPGGESCLAVKQRIGAVLEELNGKYAGKNILLVSHSLPLFFALVANDGLSERETVATPNWGSSFQNAEIKELKYRSIPRNEKYELDLHRPYIDGVSFACACGGEMKRIPEVFDCWFESGSMPYGQAHWPFAGEHFDPEKGIGFPADFIAEGVDQTRGWFYSMLVLSTALFGQTSYKNVIVNGMILAEDGQKMSKSLKNYPDPMLLVDKYGADALRFYLLASPVMRAEDLNFSEKGVGEVYRKVIMRLTNVVSFYEMYGDSAKLKAQNSKLNEKTESNNVLDIWINARLNELVAKVTEAMEKYELDRAMRPIDEFIDDLSNWFLRRSRERFKSDNEQDKNWALVTTRNILLELSKVMAPFTPFVADDIYRKLGGEKESVHLASWPMAEKYDAKIIEEMTKARELVEMGLALRDRKGLKVRQPLAEFLITGGRRIDERLLNIVAEEINIKKVKIVDEFDLSADEYEIYSDAVTGKPIVALLFILNQDLQLEGEMRELVRQIQDLRKKAGLNPGQVTNLSIVAEPSLIKVIEKYKEEIKKATTVDEMAVTVGDKTNVSITK